MRIFRGGREAKGKRVTYVQGARAGYSKSAIVTNGKLVNDQRKIDKDYKFLIDSKNKSSHRMNVKFGNNRKAVVKYKPNKLFIVHGHTEDALDDVNRPAPIMHKSTEKKSARKVYRDFLKDSEKVLETTKYNGKKKIDKEFREAIKKEIRKQHKIYKIKRVSNIAVPSALAVVGGTYLYNKNKQHKK